MSTATALDWLDAADFAPVPTPGDLQEFFGIPPAPAEALGSNIREKRKYWKKKQQKARSDDALAFAGAVLQAIADAEDALTRGAAATGGGDTEFQPGATDRAPGSVEEVWRELERLLFRGRYRDALDRVQRYDERWGQYPAFVDVRSLVILEAAKNVPGLNFKPGVLEFAIAGARQVLQQIGPTEARYLTLVELLEVAGEADQIPGVFAEADRRLPEISASFRVRELEIRFKKEAWTSVLRHCVQLVRESGDDRALRSELVQMIIARAVAELLPLDVGHGRTGVPDGRGDGRLDRGWRARGGRLRARSPDVGIQCGSACVRGQLAVARVLRPHHLVHSPPLPQLVAGQAGLAGAAERSCAGRGHEDGRGASRPRIGPGSW